MGRLALRTVAICLLVLPAWEAGVLLAQITAPGSGARVPGAPQDALDAETREEGAGIEGRVLAGSSGRPLRRAQVRLAAADSRLQRLTSTDDQGRFSFEGLPPGRYAVSASKTGFVSLEYGQRNGRESGRIITLASGQRLESADFRLPSGSAITVRVTDWFGEPFAGASVQVQQFGYTEDGVRALVPVETGQNTRAVTDDRGETRIYGLMPGDYILSATAPEAIARLLREVEVGRDTTPLQGYATTFYPGTASIGEALPVSVGVGQETWAQIAMALTPLARVSGTIVDSTGRPAGGSTIGIALASGVANTAVISRGRVTTDRNGAFAIDGVAPGEHVLVVAGGGGGPGGRGGRGSRGSESATVPLTVSGADVEDLLVVTGTGTTISGRVRSAGSDPSAGEDPVRPRIRLRQADRTLAGVAGGAATTRTASVGDDGSFRIAGASGSVLLDVSLPDTWALLSITAAGRDVTDQPIDLSGLSTVSDVVVTITDAVTRLSGSVTDRRGLPAHDGVVLIQPAERLDPVAATRRVRRIRLDEQGRFETTGLRPGRYLATAVDTLESGAERAPEVRDLLRRGGHAFTLADAEHATITLEIAEPGR